MPMYDFECPGCEEKIEIFFRSLQVDAPSCQKCGTEMVKKLSLLGGYHIKGNNSASQRPKQAGSFKKVTK